MLGTVIKNVFLKTIFKNKMLDKVRKILTNQSDNIFL